MGLLRLQGWLQQDGTSKRSVETVPHQPKLQGQQFDLGWVILSQRAHWVLRVLLFYKVSNSYPSDLFVPESATPPVIVGSSKFRSRGRFPALSYYCKENHVSWLSLIFSFLMLPTEYQFKSQSVSVTSESLSEMEAICPFHHSLESLMYRYIFIPLLGLFLSQKCRVLCAVIKARSCAMMKCVLCSWPITWVKQRAAMQVPGEELKFRILAQGHRDMVDMAGTCDFLFPSQMPCHCTTAIQYKTPLLVVTSTVQFLSISQNLGFPMPWGKTPVEKWSEKLV